MVNLYVRGFLVWLTFMGILTLSASHPGCGQLAEFDLEAAGFPARSLAHWLLFCNARVYAVGFALNALRHLCPQCCRSNWQS